MLQWGPETCMGDSFLKDDDGPLATAIRETLAKAQPGFTGLFEVRCLFDTTSNEDE